MAREYRLTQPAFHGGRMMGRGEVVSLLPHEQPGAHMVPVRVAVMPRIAPLALPVAAPVPPSPPEPIELVHVPRAGYLILDTETTGFDDPRLASLALIWTDADLAIEHTFHTLVRPDGWVMPAAIAEKVHGLTQERLEAEGSPVMGALLAFAGACALGREVVAHNLPFDMRVMANELRRTTLPAPPSTGICTMEGARKAGSKGTLALAHETLVGRPMDGDPHDAMGDAMACLEVFRALRHKERAA